MCSGVFKTIRLGSCNVRHFINQVSLRCQRSNSAGGTPRMSRYSESCGGRLGNSIVRYGDGKPMLTSAHSSSCGYSQRMGMLSMGRSGGSSSDSHLASSLPVSRK